MRHIAYLDGVSSNKAIHGLVVSSSRSAISNDIFTHTQAYISIHPSLSIYEFMRTNILIIRQLVYLLAHDTTAIEDGFSRSNTWCSPHRYAYAQLSPWIWLEMQYKSFRRNWSLAEQYLTCGIFTHRMMVSFFGLYHTCRRIQYWMTRALNSSIFVAVVFDNRFHKTSTENSQSSELSLHPHV